MDNDAYENAAGLSPWMRMWSDMAAIAMEASQGWAGPTALAGGPCGRPAPP